MRAKHERGAAAVEFALVVPLLLTLLLGISETARAYHVQAVLADAARAGVRVMALQDDPTAARSAVRSAAPGLALRDGQISITPTSCSSPGGTATVQVRYPLTVLGGSFGTSLTLHGTGVMRCNG